MNSIMIYGEFGRNSIKPVCKQKKLAKYMSNQDKHTQIRKCRTPMKALFLYFYMCLSVPLDRFSCSFILLLSNRVLKC